MMINFFPLRHTSHKFNLEQTVSVWYIYETLRPATQTKGQKHYKIINIPEIYKIGHRLSSIEALTVPLHRDKLTRKTPKCYFTFSCYNNHPSCSVYKPNTPKAYSTPYTH